MTRFGHTFDGYLGRAMIGLCYIEFDGEFRDDHYCTFPSYESRTSFMFDANIFLFSKDDYLWLKRFMAWVEHDHERMCIKAITYARRHHANLRFNIIPGLFERFAASMRTNDTYI